MNYPDLASLRLAAKRFKFRAPGNGEDESAYRAAMADHVQPISGLSAHEIRTGKDTDDMTPQEHREGLMRMSRPELFRKK